MVLFSSAIGQHFDLDLQMRHVRRGLEWRYHHARSVGRALKGVETLATQAQTLSTETQPTTITFAVRQTARDVKRKELEDTILAFHREGLTPREMATRLGRNHSPVYRMHKILCIKPNHRAKVPKPAPLPPTFEKIKITPWLLKLTKLRGLSRVRDYLIQLAICDFAESRKAAMEAPTPDCVFKTPPQKSLARRHTKICPETVQTILFLHFSEGLPVALIAKRCAVGRTSVARVLANHASSTIRVQPSTLSINHARGLGSWDQRVKRAAEKTRAKAEL